MARQFASLAAMEQDLDRIQHYRRDVAEMVPVVARRCSSATATGLHEVLNNRFLGDRTRGVLMEDL
jgi:hypothetical protein